MYIIIAILIENYITMQGLSNSRMCFSISQGKHLVLLNSDIPDWMRSVGHHPTPHCYHAQSPAALCGLVSVWICDPKTATRHDASWRRALGCRIRMVGGNQICNRSHHVQVRCNKNQPGGVWPKKHMEQCWLRLPGSIDFVSSIPLQKAICPSIQFHRLQWSCSGSGVYTGDS